MKKSLFSRLLSRNIKSFAWAFVSTTWIKNNRNFFFNVRQIKELRIETKPDKNTHTH